VPFIHRLERECVVHDMDSVVDYRRLATSTVGLYFVRLVEGRSNDDRLASALEPVCLSLFPCRCKCWCTCFHVLHSLTSHAIMPRHNSICTLDYARVLSKSS
jgi:hypothetical protein